MKKILLTLGILLVAGCSSSEKYPYDYVGVYDSITRQYINMGDTRDNVEKILGVGVEDNDFVDYNDSLTIRYDDNNEVEYIKIFDSWADSDDSPERYKFPNDITIESVVADFIDSFPYVYETKFSSVVTYVEKNDNGYIVLSKEDLCNKWKNPDSSNPYEQVYEIAADYASYEDIWWLIIDKAYPQNWDEYLKELPNSSPNNK